MPVVEKQSNLYRDAQSLGLPVDPSRIKGRVVVATGTVTNAADDLSGSSYRLCDLPSNCLVLPATAFDVQNWGFANSRVGTKTDTDALFAATTTAAPTVNPVAFGDGNHGVELWEILGLAEDPGGFITLYAHAAANATGAGNMPFQVHTIQN